MNRQRRGKDKIDDEFREKKEADPHYSDKGGHYARSPKRAVTQRAVENALWQERIKKLPPEFREPQSDEL
jgi:hypothetical protein